MNNTTDKTDLREFDTYTINFGNITRVEVVSHIDYKNHKAVAVKPYYRVYDTADAYSTYKFYDTPSKAARRVNLLLYRANSAKTVTYEDLKRGLNEILYRAQYAYNNKRSNERIESFKKEFEELLKKHNMHVLSEEDHDYYASWNYLTIVDDLMSETTGSYVSHSLNDIVESFETTKIS